MPVVVQSWVEGETLEGVLVRERIGGVPPRSLARAIDLLTPVADALGYAHARGLAHGSLAPRNLFVRDVAREDWTTVEILDLGLAQALATIQENNLAFSDPARLYFFAPTHGSPEHFAGEVASLGPQSDVFALALIVVELVSGVWPLGEGDADVLHRTAIDPVTRPTPRTYGRDLGEYAEAVFARALAVHADDRYASISAFWQALRAASRMTTTLRPSLSSSRIPAFPSMGSGVRAVSGTLAVAQRESVPAGSGAGEWESGARLAKAAPASGQESAAPASFETQQGGALPGTNPLGRDKTG